MHTAFMPLAKEISRISTALNYAKLSLRTCPTSALTATLSPSPDNPRHLTSSPPHTPAASLRATAQTPPAPSQTQQMPRRRAGHHHHDAAARARRLHHPANTVLPLHPLPHPPSSAKAARLEEALNPVPLLWHAHPQQPFLTRTARR